MPFLPPNQQRQSTEGILREPTSKEKDGSGREEEERA